LIYSAREQLTLKTASGTARILEDGFTISRVNPFIGGNAT
jgi:hypothetical protein